MDELPVSSNWTLAVWIEASLIRRKVPPLTSMPSIAILKSENGSNMCDSSVCNASVDSDVTRMFDGGICLNLT